MDPDISGQIRYKYRITSAVKNPDVPPSCESVPVTSASGVSDLIDLVASHEHGVITAEAEGQSLVIALNGARAMLTYFEDEPSGMSIFEYATSTSHSGKESSIRIMDDLTTLPEEKIVSRDVAESILLMFSQCGELQTDAEHWELM